MPTVAEVLRQTGFSEEQIKALDAKAVTAFEGIITNSEKERQEAVAAREQAELAQRSNVEFYETRIAPSLSAWEEEKAKIGNEVARQAAEAAFYRTQAEEARKSGFIPGDAPNFDPSKFTPPAPQPRNPQGQWVAGTPGGTPGSPQFFDVNQVYQRAGDAVGVIADIQWEHERLFGAKMPISPTELVRQADAVKLDPKTYASRTFNWDTRREQMRKDDEEKRNKEIAAAAIAPYEQKMKEAEEAFKKNLADNDRKWAEVTGNNPDIRRPVASQFSDISRAVNNKDVPHPLDLNDQQRRQLTSQMIRKDIEAQQQA